MIKIVLKEPVGGMISGNNIPARSVNYLEARGLVDDELIKSYDTALQYNESLPFVSPQDVPFLVPARNIAYMLQTNEK